MDKWKPRMRRFTLIKNYSIPARLHMAGALALMGLLVTGGAGYIGLTQSNVGLEVAITSTSAVLNQKNADMMHDALRADVLYALQIGPEGSAQLRGEIADDLAGHIADFNQNIDTLRALPLDPAIRADVEAILPALSDYTAAAQNVVGLALTNRAAGQTGWDAFMVAFSNLETGMGILGEAIEAQGNKAGIAATERNAFLIKVVLGALSACIVVMILSNFLLARSITKPISRVKQAIQQVVEGNLGGRHSSFDRASDRNDEVSQIGVHLEFLRIRLREAVQMEAAIKHTQADQEVVVAALTVGLENLSQGRLSQTLDQAFPEHYEGLRSNFNATVEHLNQTMSQVATASRAIRARADDISQASEDLSRRTENQAATLEETAAALDELTTSVKAAANGAREVESIVQNTRTEAEESGKVVLSAVDAMNGIERSSDQISRIISVIDDIAFQTNLLALNAGVEAARAGDSGRGFAVVASEVRALAQRSSEASREIKELITTSTQLVGRGVDAVGSAGKALNNMVERVTHISSLVSGIATGAIQQSTALGEVNVGVTQLDQVAQRNAAMVEQSMSSTQSLQREAMGLDTLMSRFVTTGAPSAMTETATSAPHLRAAS